jgi:hypothetical protein
VSRRRAVLALLVVALLAAVPVTLGFAGVKPFATWLGRCGIVDSVPANEGTAAPLPGIRVAEQGFTQPVDERDAVSLGAVLENPSDRIAYHTRVTFQVLDAEGRTLPTVRGAQATDDQVPVILPGQRVGVGSTVKPTTPNAVVATVRVTVEVGQWIAGDALGDDFAPVTAEYRRTVRGAGMGAEIAFVPRSTSCRPLKGAVPEASVLFRDQGGKVVGGVRLFNLGHCAQSRWESTLSPLQPIPRNADDARTEIYLYCDVR